MRVEISVIIHGKLRTYHDADIHFKYEMTKCELLHELEHAFEMIVNEHFIKSAVKEQDE